MLVELYEALRYFDPLDQAARTAQHLGCDARILEESVKSSGAMDGEFCIVHAFVRNSSGVGMHMVTRLA